MLTTRNTGRALPRNPGTAPSEPCHSWIHQAIISVHVVKNRNVGILNTHMRSEIGSNTYSAKKMRTPCGAVCSVPRGASTKYVQRRRKKSERKNAANLGIYTAIVSL